MLARAPGDRFGLGDFYLLRLQAGAFMRAVAEGLALGTPAGAPPICARLNFLNDRRFLKDGWFSHVAECTRLTKNVQLVCLGP